MSWDFFINCTKDPVILMLESKMKKAMHKMLSITQVSYLLRKHLMKIL